LRVFAPLRDMNTKRTSKSRSFLVFQVTGSGNNFFSKSPDGSGLNHQTTITGTTHWTLHFNQLFDDPLSIQQMIEFFSAVVRLPVFGIRPDNTAARICALARSISE
jgi:hypothetical protein